MAADANGERNLDRGFGLILGELRDLRVEMRADRQRADEERRRADEERRRADDAWREERRQSDAAWREERRQADAAWREERRQADARFERIVQDFQQDSARRETATQQAFRDISTIGLSIVKTLNHHTRILERHGQLLERHGQLLERHGQILERIDRTLVTWATGRPEQGNGRDTAPGS